MLCNLQQRVMSPSCLIYGSALPCMPPPVGFLYFMSQAYCLPNLLNLDIMFPSQRCFPGRASNECIYFLSFQFTLIAS